MIMTKDYYESPTQVLFLDFESIVDGAEGIHYIGGIAYQDEIICGCCGGTFPIEELIKDYDDYVVGNPWLDAFPLIRPMPWIDISNDIIGGAPMCPSEVEE